MVEHRDGSKEMKYADMQKTIYSLPALRELLLAANHRYLELLSALDDNTAGTDKLKKISCKAKDARRSYRGFNFFDDEDQKLFQSLARGEFNISGFQSKNLRRQLQDKTSGQISRLLKRLRLHGLIKKIGKTYKYYLTAFGKVITLGLKLKHLYIIPSFPLLPQVEISCQDWQAFVYRGTRLFRRLRSEKEAPSGQKPEARSQKPGVEPIRREWLATAHARSAQ